jgi:hypothetical protein
MSGLIFLLEDAEDADNNRALIEPVSSLVFIMGRRRTPWPSRGRKSVAAGGGRWRALDR